MGGGGGVVSPQVPSNFMGTGLTDHLHFGETNQHLAARIRQGLSTDKNSHIFQHLESSETCQASCSEACFSILDTFQLKIQEALHIGWEQPSLDKQIYYVNLSLAM